MFGSKAFRYDLQIERKAWNQSGIRFIYGHDSYFIGVSEIN